MATKKLRDSDKQFYEKLGRRLGKIILQEKGYKSLDAFALEHHDLVTKPTLYQMVAGTRDVRLATFRKLADALGMPVTDLIRGL